jgi:Transposase zinc-ribbon domain
MIDFPIDELLDDNICTHWLEQHLHPDGLTCPHCGHAERRLFHVQGHFPAYRCRACDGYYTLLTGAIFAKTRQRPATLVLLLRGVAKSESTGGGLRAWRRCIPLLLRGVAKGESTARLARELGLSRKQLVVPENPSLLTDLTFARLACMVDQVTSPDPEPYS